MRTRHGDRAAMRPGPARWPMCVIRNETKVIRFRLLHLRTVGCCAFVYGASPKIIHANRPGEIIIGEIHIEIDMDLEKQTRAPRHPAAPHHGVRATDE